MNDFTKEELETISESLLSSCFKLALSFPNDYLEDDIYRKFANIRDKIPAMIDNYCEHEWEGYTARNIRCRKCKQDIWHE